MFRVERRAFRMFQSEIYGCPAEISSVSGIWIDFLHVWEKEVLMFITLNIYLPLMLGDTFELSDNSKKLVKLVNRNTSVDCLLTMLRWRKQKSRKRFRWSWWKRTRVRKVREIQATNLQKRLQVQVVGDSMKPFHAVDLKHYSREIPLLFQGHQVPLGLIKFRSQWLNFCEDSTAHREQKRKLTEIANDNRNWENGFKVFRSDHVKAQAKRCWQYCHFDGEIEAQQILNPVLPVNHLKSHRYDFFQLFTDQTSSEHQPNAVFIGQHEVGAFHLVDSNFNIPAQLIHKHDARNYEKRG